MLQVEREYGEFFQPHELGDLYEEYCAVASKRGVETLTMKDVEGIFISQNFMEETQVHEGDQVIAFFNPKPRTQTLNPQA